MMNESNDPAMYHFFLQKEKQKILIIAAIMANYFNLPEPPKIHIPMQKWKPHV